MKKALITLALFILTLTCFGQKKDTTAKDTTWAIVLSSDELKAFKDFIDKTSNAPHPQVPNLLMFIDSRKRVVEIKPRL
jgi:hypothetical protein